MPESFITKPPAVRRYGVAVVSVGVALLLSIYVPTSYLEKRHSALFFVAVMVSTWYGGRESGLLATALSAAAIEYVLDRPFDAALAGAASDMPFLEKAAAYVVRVSVFVAAAVFISSLNEGRLRAELAARASDLEMRIARQVQQKLFPADVPHVPGFDIFGVSSPAGATGGDYFDYFPLPDGRLGLVVGDVSGHGLGPALLMSATRAYLRAVALSHADLSTTLALTNRLLCQDTGSRQFVALLFASLEPHSRSFVYAAAGQGGYLLDASGEVTRLDTTSPPIGIDPDLTYPCAAPVVLEPGQAVLVFTDGIVEAVSPEGTFFGIDRVLEVARAARGRTAAEMARALCQAVHDFSQHRPQRDDITVVVIKARPAEEAYFAASRSASVTSTAFQEAKP